MIKKKKRKRRDIMKKKNFVACSLSAGDRSEGGAEGVTTSLMSRQLV